jgi:hypothetical protein
MELNEPEASLMVDENPAAELASETAAPVMEETAPFDWEAEMKRYEAERL